MSKKMISALMASCLCGGLILSPLTMAEAAKASVAPIPSPKINGDLSQAKLPLDQAITKAKEIFAISPTYEQFESGINTYDGRTEWQLNWTKNTEPRGNISVRINAVTGEILGMDRWEDLPPGQRFSGIPKYSYDEGAKAATEWAKKLAPNYMAQVTLTPNQDNPFYGFGERGSAEYYYNFTRVVNGVSFPEHNITVRFNGDTGQFVGFNLQWQDQVSFPSPTGKISSAQAEKVFGENVELIYFRPQRSGAKDAPVKLAYRIKKGTGLFIDAFKGEVINDSGYSYYDRAMDGAAGMANAEKSAVQELSPVEQADVDKYKNLLSAEKALEQFKKMIQVPADLKQTESRLTQDYQYPEQKIWNFYWNGESSTSYESMNAGVDAVTGELISFNRWQKTQYNTVDQKSQLTQEQAQKKAEEFIKKQQTTRSGQIKLANGGPDEYMEKGNPRSYHFSYDRLVNNIPFINNGFEVRVDAFTGEITSYRMIWWNLSFPNTQGSLEQPKAVTAFLADGGLKLEYLRLTRGKNDAPLNLVYRLKNDASTMLDAKTGQLLGWNGQPVPPKQTNVFTDIAGNPAENDINLLAKANIVKSQDGKFYPDRNINKLEALEMLVASRGWYQEPVYRILQGKEKDEQVKRVISAAISLGIIEPGEDQNLEQELSRLDLAKLMINTLDYDGVAKLPQIYQLKSKDAEVVPAEWKGYAALSLGLGLQNELQANYEPTQKVTRGAAATSLVHMLQVKK